VSDLLAFAERHPWPSVFVFLVLCATLIAVAQAFGRKP
jgi:hypothetical protein